MIENVYLWFLPCNETPFLNRNHPVFLAIKDRVVACDEGRILLEKIGWVNPASCVKTRSEAEEQLYFHMEALWIDRGDWPERRNTLNDYIEHQGCKPFVLPWFDLHSLLYEGDAHATS